MSLPRRHTHEQFVQTIRDQTDIISVVSIYLALKKTGQNYVGVCPFHDEKTPSFSVSPAKQFFHCFGCGIGGDVFRFFMQIEGVSFPQALKQLADRAGIPMPVRPTTTRSSEVESEKEALVRINQAAAAYFHHNLLHRPEGQFARAYLFNRGILQETIGAFEMGFALPSWDGLIRHFGERFSIRLLEKAGLVVSRERNGYYDRFRGRLMFPIKDLKGEIIAFGGRVINGDQPKYLNSPETPLYSKGKNLFALDRVRGNSEKVIVLVEGYFDAIVAHQAGVQNVVATLGTALTLEHLYLLKRLCQKVVVIFDPDAAGMRATLRAAALFGEMGLPAEAVALPEGEDPDLFVRRKGKEGFLDAISRGTRLMEAALSYLVAGVYSGSIDAKLTTIGEAFPLIQKIQNNIEKGYYLRWLADTLALPEETLRKEFNRMKKGPTLNGRSTPTAVSEGPPPREEEIFVHILLQQPERIKAMQGVKPNDFTDKRTRRIIQYMVDSNTSPPGPEEEGFSFYAELLVREAEYDDPEKTLQDCLVTLRAKKRKEEGRKIGDAIRVAELAGDWERVKMLQKEIYVLMQQISK